MKKLIGKFATWWLADVLKGWQDLHNKNIHLMAHQNDLIRHQNEQIQLNHLQIDRLNAQVYGRLH